jgi:DNA-directed RNA polymerase subunit K/omega
MEHEDLQPEDIGASEPNPAIPAEPVEPPHSRFLFVDVAAMRAKQLRRGALPRLNEEGHHPLKAERIAMEEVRRGMVSYDLPEFRSRAAEEAAGA